MIDETLVFTGALRAGGGGDQHAPALPAQRVFDHHPPAGGAQDPRVPAGAPQRLSLPLPTFSRTRKCNDVHARVTPVLLRTGIRSCPFESQTFQAGEPAARCQSAT